VKDHCPWSNSKFEVKGTLLPFCERAGYENIADGVFGLLAQPEKVVPTFNGFFEKNGDQ